MNMRQMEVSEYLHAMANLPQGKEAPVGPRADLDMVMERKISVLPGIKLQFSGHPTTSLITTLPELSWPQ
jgi:hypothetical protein